ncbi:MAG TPA: DUF4398 domain-containing protein [Burkholderiales bacterium]|nr:DUF4398 domain-containing protein [Burkholderiales bacterium]
MDTYILKTGRKLSRWGLIGTAVVFMGGCASTPPPVAQMAVAKTALSNASTAGGEEYAPLQLKEARDKMDAAQRAMAAHHYGLASRLAEEAQVDAELAIAKARSDKAAKAAAAVKKDSNALRQQINNNAQ